MMDYTDSEYCSEGGKPIDDRWYARTAIRIKRYGRLEDTTTGPGAKLECPYRIEMGQEV